MRGAVVVAGAIARRWNRGGHVWALLQWVLGFRRLGWQVLFLDRLEPGAPERSSRAVAGFVEIMEAFGLEDSYSLDLGPDRDWIGVKRAPARERVASADLLLNIMGYLEDDDLLGVAHRRVFLDIDPGFGQMWKTLGWCDLLAGHDVFLTVGANVGKPFCPIPDCGFPWVATLPPVALHRWPASPTPGHRFTSVGSWRGPYDPVEFGGVTYGLRVHEFRRYTSLPQVSGLPFEVVLDMDDADARDAERLRLGGWRVIPPERAALRPADYQRYIRTSRAEFLVAKGMYVRSRSGWFSDRTACYLASGRPAVVQDTGLESVLETGQGLLLFDGLDEALASVREVDGHWNRHARAARDLAEAHLDSDRVLPRVIDLVTV